MVSATVKDELEKLKKTLEEKLTTENKKLLDSWQATKELETENARLKKMY